MAQNPYLQNLLGINQGGMGLYNYNYSLPTYNTLLSKGLTEDQIKGYDTGFNTFNQFPYKVQPNPNLNYPQYGVVPQAPDVDPITTDPPPTEAVAEAEEKLIIAPMFEIPYPHLMVISPAMTLPRIFILIQATNQ